MDQLLKNMEPRTMALLMVSVALLVAAALGSYVIWPKAQSYRQSINTLATLESVVSQQASIGMQVATLESELEALQHQLQGDMVNLPENQMESFVIGELQGISWRNKIELLGVRPGKGGLIQGFEEILFDVEVAGDYFDLYTWLQELGDKLGFVVIKSFNIRPLDARAAEPRLTARLTIVSYREAGNA
jgi:Tfp pilus assembly protein PilO